MSEVKDTPLIRLHGVSKRYAVAAGAFDAVADLSLELPRGEFTAVIGASGSGKTTLLHLLAGIERPSSGEIVIAGEAVHALPEHALSAWRGRQVGVVFQFFQLLPGLTAIENVMLPMDFCRRWPRQERRERAHALLQRFGVADQADKPPFTLSGGQQQRVAVARALANAPALLLADEPTGNLDSRAAQGLREELAALAREGQTVIVVTHDRDAMRDATRVIELRDGRVLSDMRREAGAASHA